MGEEPLAFVGGNGETNFSELTENSSEMFLVFVEGLGDDANIIKIDEDEVPFHACENTSHDTVEVAGGILESHAHAFVLVQTVMSHEGGFGAVFWGNEDLVETVIEVKAGAEGFGGD